MARWSVLFILLLGSFMGALSACTPPASATPRDTVTLVAISDGAPSATREIQTATTHPSSPTPFPTVTSSPTPPATPTSTVTSTPTATATLVNCLERIPGDDLLTFVNREFGLGRDYVPQDLVALSDYFPNSITLGYPTEVRAVILEPLQQVIEAMQDDGLSPQIISGYRSFSTQSLALQKWLEQYPDWANNLSAPPGHSEHQLGTTIDFGSPELKYMLGDENIQFHPAFAQTSEGNWLTNRAPEYGFTMSYPADAFDRTTFYHEPWHFRYVGPDLALSLAAENLTLSEYLQHQQPQPCLVD